MQKHLIIIIIEIHFLKKITYSENVMRKTYNFIFYILFNNRHCCLTYKFGI